MAQVVRFWPQIRRLGPSDSPIEKWHGPLLKKYTLADVGTAVARGIIHTQLRVAINALDYQ